MDPQHPEDETAEVPGVLQQFEEAIRARDSLQLLRVEFQRSTIAPTGIVFHLTSDRGEHHVELRRREWALLDPNEVANFVAQRVVNEIRWRRNRG